MAVYRRPARTRNVIAVLVLVALTLITVDARSNGRGVVSNARGKFSDAFSPLQRATHAALAPIGNFLTGAADYGSLRKENERLREQIAGLQSQGVRSAAAEQAAEQVLKDAGLPYAGAVPGVTVQIVEAGSSNFDNTVIVSKGTSSGLATGQPVVAAGGLVGSVVAVTRHTATVRLLTDPSFAVGVALPGGNYASVAGQGRTEPLHLTVDTPNLPPPVLNPGDSVVTSGLSLEKFPKGIPVGKVVKVSTPPGAIEPDVSLDPLVDLGRLAYVEVLLWSPQVVGGTP